MADTFTSANIRAMAQGHNPLQIQYLKEELRHSITLKFALDTIYNYLLPKYRNEYIFRNEVISSIYGERHQLSVSHMFCEFDVGKSRTDLAVLNGTSTCYEIKTDIDTLRRLDGQIGDYCQFFDRVYVAVSEDRLTQALNILPCNIGIIVFDSDKRIHDFRQAESNIENINPRFLFQAMHQKEQRSIGAKYDPSSIELNAVDGYYRCLEIFDSLNSHQAHIEFMEVVKSRKSQRADAQFECLPRALSGAYLSTKMTNKMWGSLIQRLHQPL